MNERLKVYFDREHQLVICRPVGTLSAQDTGELLYFLRGVEGSEPGPFNRLLDLSLVTEIELRSAAIYEYARARREDTHHFQRFRSAVIAPTPETEVAAEIYATLMESSTIEVRIFGDTEAAANWLGVSEEAVRVESQRRHVA